MLQGNSLFHQRFEENTLGNDYVVGDIHGHYDLLLAQLERLKFNHKIDRLFALGDLINRGPRSLDCLNLLLKPWFFSVIGNHEAYFKQCVNQGFDKQLFYKMGGQWIDDVTYPDGLTKLAALVHYRMPLAIEISIQGYNIGLIHAQSPDDWEDIHNKNFLDDCESDCLWSLDKFNRSQDETKSVKNIDMVVHGHANCDQIVVKANQAWIDTVRVTDKLTILSLSELLNWRA
ncbi:metallophosphoesterase [Endozoicomonas sp. G2_1]|uniref:metallophosphoesterase n=1 Tax=Endozoicomonas sp. G2_1 TaxID=2821091 RepID=UPI001AD96465|nr:metallophosphoesterase [Endozoicomonas sp. G2_1]MBO9492200.1 metallophosphoesterase [Endozoicomonas sp. G2_1]